MALLDTNDLCVAHFRIYDKSSRTGTTESCHFIPPSAATKGARLRAAAPSIIQLAKHRANLFPDQVYMGYIHISFLDAEFDGKQILGQALFGPQSGGTPKWDTTNDGTTSASFRFQGPEGNAITYWLNYLPDQWMVGSQLTINGGSNNIGIRDLASVPTPLALGTYSNTDLTLIQKWMDAYLTLTVFGRKWKGTGSPTALFQQSPWDDGVFNRVARRKHGVGWGAPKGRRAAGA